MEADVQGDLQKSKDSVQFYELAGQPCSTWDKLPKTDRYSEKDFHELSAAGL